MREKPDESLTYGPIALPSAKRFWLLADDGWCGSLSRTDRVAKYNQLLRIEQLLGAHAVYGGKMKNV